MEDSNKLFGTIIASNAEVASKSNKTLKTCFSQASMEDSDHHQSTQSGALIGSNEDLLTEILIRLPVTSILRFKSVSKQWRLLLSNSHLTHRYDNNNLSKTPRLFGRPHLTRYLKSDAHLAGDIYVPLDVENRSTPPFRSLDFYFNHSGVRIAHSCNGLLLCFTIHINGASEYYVFNPATKKLSIIPTLPKAIRFMALAFDQKHYKVVCILGLDPSKEFCQIQVYSSNTRKWKICINFFYAPKAIFDNPVYWNGTVYWASSCQNNLWYFKLDAEQLQMLPLPVEMMSYETNIMYFGELRGHLHLIFHTDGEEYVLQVNVYEMLMDHSGWIVKYRVQLYELLRDFPCVRLHYKTPGDGDFWGMGHLYQNGFQVVDVVRGKEEEDTFLVLVTRGKMIRYNVHTKSFKELYRCDNYNLHLSSFHRYIETLSSFKKTIRFICVLKCSVKYWFIKVVPASLFYSPLLFRL
ncbi:F-box protein At5g07610-like [Bidens hawaiensis]|uniref:F-box protein At5g07610-like n=1 Tax=Bidens hawaiensis TaxID=980011 RepID=UPI00404B4722